MIFGKARAGEIPMGLCSVLIHSRWPSKELVDGYRGGGGQNFPSSRNGTIRDQSCGVGLMLARGETVL